MKQYSGEKRKSKVVTDLRSEERFTEALYSLALVIQAERRVEKQRPRRHKKGYRSDAA